MKSILFLLFSFISFFFIAQTVGINSTGAIPSTSAMLDVSANDKGLLIPRINIADLNTATPVSSPTTSLLVYNTNTTSGVGYYFWNGSKWINLKDADSNSDEDWHEVGSTNSPDNINDDIFTMGKVGIGLNNPVAILHVSSNGLNGTVNPLRSVVKSTVVPGSSNGYNLFYGSGGTTLNLGNVYGVHLDFSAGGTTYGVYSEGEKYNYFSGNLGIGTTSPNAPLEISPVNVSSIQEGIRLIDEGAGSSEGLWLQFGQVVTDDYARIGGRSYNNTSGGLYFSTKENADASPIEKMRIAPNGNVGIGTTTPLSKLHIKNGTLLMDGNTSKIYLKASAGSIDPGDIVFVNGNGTNKARIWAEPSFNQGLQLNGSGDGVVHLKIESNGNVGIGLTNPSTKLHVKSSNIGDNVNDEQNLFTFQTAPTGGNTLHLDFKNRRHIAGNNWFGTNSRLQRRIDGTAQAFIDFGIDGVSASYGLGFGTRNGLGGTQQTRMVINDIGNVGIGTTAPTAKLQVVGILEFADNAAALAGGLTIGAFYRTGDLLKVVH